MKELLCKLDQYSKIFHCLTFWSLPLFTSFLILLFVNLHYSPFFTKKTTPTAPQLDPINKLPLQLQKLQVIHKLETDYPIATSRSPDLQQFKPKPDYYTAPIAQQKKLYTKLQYIAPSVEIRVAIASNAKTTVIASSTTANILDNDGNLIDQLSANKSWQAKVQGVNVVLEDYQFPSIVWVEPTQGGGVYIGDRWYRGRLMLVSQGSTLLVVNYVDLEEYLVSVVGSEMSASVPIEALKAQAVAARSYALTHIFRPANNFYDLGAGERWQAYKGLDSEYNTTQEAVEETAGEILSNQGGVVESLYAASQKIVNKVHGGVGMSQTGAYALAVQGYDYEQILATYYPGAEITRLEMQR